MEDVILLDVQRGFPGWGSGMNLGFVLDGGGDLYFDLFEVLLHSPQEQDCDDYNTIQELRLLLLVMIPSQNYMNDDYGTNNEGNYQQIETKNLGDLYGQSRLQFIRKVYTILALQLVITALFSIWSINSVAFLVFQNNNTWLMIVCLIGMITSQIWIMCCDGGRHYPKNMILLAVFTLCESYCVSYICGITATVVGTQTVVIAALMTAAMVTAITIYAYKTETDFTASWGIIVVVSVVLLILGLVTMFTDNPFLHNLYCAVGIICFGLYLIVDTQMIMGGRQVSLSVDDYVVAALYLYIDIIQIFLYILELLRNLNSGGD